MQHMVLVVYVCVGEEELFSIGSKAEIHRALQMKSNPSAISDESHGDSSALAMKSIFISSAGGAE